MTPDDKHGAEADDLLGTSGLGIDRAALARYVIGECDPVESARITAWLATSDRARALVGSLRTIWRSSADVARPPDAHAATNWEHLQARIQAAPSIGPQHVSVLRRLRGMGRIPDTWPRRVGGHDARWPGRLWVAGGATGILIAGLALGITLDRVSGGRARVSEREYATRAGEREIAMLADGTRFTLAPASRLTVPADYAAGHRAITLEGEALFTVVHDATHPFTVETRGMLTQDVGTVFDIRAYSDDAAVRIAVVGGVVRVGTTRVQAGDVATVDHTGVVVVHRGDVSAEVAWMQGQLVFEDTPLRRAITELARTFDLEIRVDDPVLLDRAITTSVGNEPVDEVLETVAFAVGASVTRTGRTVVFQRNPAITKPQFNGRIPEIRTAQGAVRSE